MNGDYNPIEDWKNQELEKAKNQANTEIKAQNWIRENRFNIALGSIGLVSGIAYSVVNKTGFWKGVGYTLLFNIGGHALGKGIDVLIKK